MRRAVIFTCLAIIAIAGFYGCASTIDAPSRGAKLCVTSSVSFPPNGKQVPDTARVHLASCSTDPVVISEVTISGDGFSFVRPLSDTTILPGDTIYTRVLYSPDDSIPDAGSISITSNAGPLTIPITGAGVGPSRAISVVPLVNFGNVRLGLCEDSMLGQKAEISLTIRNTGSETLHLGTVTIGLPFNVLAVECDSISSGDSCHVRLGFCPQAYGEVIGQLRIASDALGADALKIVSVRGTGIVYLPGRESFFNEDYINNDSLTSKTLKTVVDSNVARVGGPRQNLFLQCKTPISDLDTSWFFSTADTSNIFIYINAYIRGSQEPVNKPHWYPFRKQVGAFDTTFKVNDRDVKDSVIFLAQKIEDIGGRNIHVYKARWHRVVSISGDQEYAADAELWYAKTLGIVFIRRTFDTQSNENIIHTMTRYNFK